MENQDLKKYIGKTTRVEAVRTNKGEGVVFMGMIETDSENIMPVVFGIPDPVRDTYFIEGIEAGKTYRVTVKGEKEGLLYVEFARRNFPELKRDIDRLREEAHKGRQAFEAAYASLFEELTTYSPRDDRERKILEKYKATFATNASEVEKLLAATQEKTRKLEQWANELRIVPAKEEDIPQMAELNRLWTSALFRTHSQSQEQLIRQNFRGGGLVGKIGDEIKASVIIDPKDDEYEGTFLRLVGLSEPEPSLARAFLRSIVPRLPSGKKFLMYSQGANPSWLSEMGLVDKERADNGKLVDRQTREVIKMYFYTVPENI